MDIYEVVYVKFSGVFTGEGGGENIVTIFLGKGALQRTEGALIRWKFILYITVLFLAEGAVINEIGLFHFIKRLPSAKKAKKGSLLQKCHHLSKAFQRLRASSGWIMAPS